MKRIYSVPLVALLVGNTSGPAGAQVPVAEISHIHGIAFDLADNESVFLATHRGLFKATTAGTAEPISENQDDYMGFSPHPTDPSLLFASGHPAEGGNVGVIVSHDAGATWNRLADGVGGPVDFHGMTISRADPQIIYGLYDGIQVSRDGGLTWTMAGPSPHEVIDLAAAPTETEVLYAATLRGLMRSEDAGQTWDLVGPADVQVSMVEAAPDGSLFAFVVGAGLMRQPREGGEWVQLGADFGQQIILHLAADPDDADHLVAVTQESQVIESTDGGFTWTPWGV